VHGVRHGVGRQAGRRQGSAGAPHLQVGVGHVALKPRHDAPLDEAEDGGQRPDAQLPADAGHRVDVQLREADGAAGASGDALQARGELLARLAPVRPAVEDDGHGGLHDGGGEV